MLAGFLQEFAVDLFVFQGAIQQGFDKSFDGKNGCFQFMGDIAEEFATEGFHFLQFLDLL